MRFSSDRAGQARLTISFESGTVTALRTRASDAACVRCWGWTTLALTAIETKGRAIGAFSSNTFSAGAGGCAPMDLVEGLSISAFWSIRRSRRTGYGSHSSIHGGEMTIQAELNPYTPPRAALEHEAHRPPSDIRMFPRFSAWGVFGLAMVTFGIYYTYWLYSRTKILNRLTPADPIPSGLGIAAILLMACTIAFEIARGAYGDDGFIRVVASVASLTSSAANLIWVFMFRNRLNQHSQAQPRRGYWVYGLPTFFLQPLYLQYKINEQIDAQLAASAPAEKNSHVGQQHA